MRRRHAPRRLSFFLRRRSRARGAVRDGGGGEGSCVVVAHVVVAYVVMAYVGVAYAVMAHVVVAYVVMAYVVMTYSF